MDSSIKNEFVNAKFGDLRLKDRLMSMVSQLSNCFRQSIPMACQDWAATKGAYRVLGNYRVSEADVLEVHLQSEEFKVTRI